MAILFVIGKDASLISLLKCRYLDLGFLIVSYIQTKGSNGSGAIMSFILHINKSE